MAEPLKTPPTGGLTEVVVHGYDDYSKKIKEIEETKDKNQILFVLFTGSKDKDGKSWCPDCVKAEPIIKEALSTVTNETAMFLEVRVGERDEWKKPDNQFRKDNRIKLSSVPTLMKWGTAHRLGDDKCTDKDLVKLLFEDI